MKILLLNYSTVNFGAYFRVLLLARYLKKNNPDFTIKMLTLNDKTSFFVKKRSIEGVDLYLIPIIEHTKVRVGIFTILFFILNTLIRTIYYCYFALFTDYDILHSFTLAQPYIALTTRLTWHLRKDKKIVIDWDDLWTGGASTFFPPFIQKIMSHFEYDYLKYGQGYTCNSGYLKDELHSCGIPEEKILLLPNGCDIDQVYPVPQSKAREKLQIPEERRILLILGNTHKYNDFLFKALEEVLRDEVYLYIIGYAEDLSLPNVIAVGRQPHDTIKYWLSASDILLMPMSDDVFNKTRFPLRFADYLCVGKPIVSNAIGDVKYYMENFHCGLVSDPNDPNTLRENIVKLLRDEKLRQRYAENGLKVAQNELNWHQLARKMTHLYEKLLPK